MKQQAAEARGRRAASARRGPGPPCAPSRSPPTSRPRERPRGAATPPKCANSEALPGA